LYTEKILICRDCNQNFMFTVGEQEFFASRGFTNEPSRCPECRAERKRTQNTGYGGGYGGGYARTEREMFPAVCAQCGKDTQVPFQPKTDRPVYCSDCFANMRGSSYEGAGRNRY
jgi:CxxC-x17-CxxC domain-containing protein